jgi:ribosomal protein L44E
MSATKSQSSSPVKGWTAGRFKSFVTSALRGGFTRYPPKFEVLKNAFVSKKTNKATGRLASHYKCAKCKKQFVAKDVQVDHKDPVVGEAGWESWDVYIERLYCTVDNLQVLCKGCHAVKTKEERKKK